MVIRKLLVLFLVLFGVFVVPVSADYNSSGYVSYSYAESNSYSITGTDYLGTATVPLTSFYHRFTDAQVINIANFNINSLYRDNTGYSKNSATTFSATVDSIYYGSGIVSFYEDGSGYLYWNVDFDNVDEIYASTLLGQKTVSLTYDSSIRDSISLHETDFMRGSGGITAEKPDGLIGDGSNTVWNIGTFSSYSMYYYNSYDYSFNTTHNLSSINISKCSSSTLWRLLDFDDETYIVESGYSTTDYDNVFLSTNGVIANVSFNLAPVVYKEIILNSIVVQGDGLESDLEYNITTDQDEYSPGDTVNVTYTTDQKGTIQVVKTVSGDIYHSIGFVSGATNATWEFYIAENEPYGLYDVHLLDSSNSILDTVRYSLLPTTSSLDILQSSVDLHETFVVFAQTVNESILSIEDPDGVEVWNESIGALMYDYIYYTPTIKTGIYTAYLYDDATLNDTVMVFLADPPIIDDPLDPETNGSIVVEDVLGEDESMTEYYNEKFRDFAPTIWGFFMLMCLLFLMSILTSFNSGGKR